MASRARLCALSHGDETPLTDTCNALHSDSRTGRRRSVTTVNGEVAGSTPAAASTPARPMGTGEPMPDPLRAIGLRRTPQSEPADPRQVPNNAAGYTFTVAPIERLRRFLVLGTDGGTYYTSERELTKDNANV